MNKETALKAVFENKKLSEIWLDFLVAESERSNPKSQGYNLILEMDETQTHLRESKTKTIYVIDWDFMGNIIEDNDCKWKKTGIGEVDFICKIVNHGVIADGKTKLEALKRCVVKMDYNRFSSTRMDTSKKDIDYRVESKAFKIKKNKFGNYCTVGSTGGSDESSLTIKSTIDKLIKVIEKDFKKRCEQAITSELFKSNEITSASQIIKIINEL